MRLLSNQGVFEQIVSQGRHVTPICTRAWTDQTRTKFLMHESKYLEEAPLEARSDVGSRKLIMPGPALDFIDAVRRRRYISSTIEIPSLY